MKRKLYHFDEGMIEKLDKHKINFGLSSVAAFIRFIINDWFKKNKI